MDLTFRTKCTETFFVDHPSAHDDPIHWQGPDFVSREIQANNVENGHLIHSTAGAKFRASFACFTNFYRRKSPARSDKCDDKSLMRQTRRKKGAGEKRRSRDEPSRWITAQRRYAPLLAVSIPRVSCSTSIDLQLRASSKETRSSENARNGKVPSTLEEDEKVVKQTRGEFR